jgi:predicted RNA methylase
MKATKTMLLAACALIGAHESLAVDDSADRPKSLQHEAEIVSLLDSAAWVSPHLSNDKVLYMVSWQSCPYCLAYERDDFPKLQAAGVDTRVIVYARAASSTPQERVVLRSFGGTAAGIC